MSYNNRRPYAKKSYNYKNNYYNNKERIPYKKYPYRKSRSRSHSYSPKNKKYSKKIHNMFNMYNKNEHLSSSSHSSDSSNNEYSIDRAKTCPFLLRIFYKVNGYNSLRNFSGDNFPPELDIYTWEDANLKELANFIHKALKDTFSQFNELLDSSDGAAKAIGQALATAVNVASKAFFTLAKYIEPIIKSNDDCRVPTQTNS